MSTKGEGKRSNSRVEKCDFELPIGDGPRLPDQLVQARLGHLAVPLE
jgi:hypothetical protein